MAFCCAGLRPYSQNLVDVLGVTLIVIYIVALIGGRVYFYLRCPHCKQRHTMKECDRTTLRRERRSQKVGEGRGSYTRHYFVATYCITYVCENCGHTIIRYRTQEED